MSPVETRTPPARRGLLSNPSGVMIGLLIGVRVLIAGLDLGHTGGLSDDVDVRRFVQIVDTPGRAYRDFPVEYMPLELISIHGLVGGSLRGATPLGRAHGAAPEFEVRLRGRNQVRR